ncbi:MAG: hypothetical protein Q9211_006347 [Gyalolechia sp. 1 TL-2023]
MSFRQPPMQKQQLIVQPPPTELEPKRIACRPLQDDDRRDPKMGATDGKQTGKKPAKQMLGGVTVWLGPPVESVEPSWMDQEYAEASDDSFSRMSIGSKIHHYPLENGRTYHAYRDGQYWAPNDRPAQELEGISHHAFLRTLNDRILLAPIHNPRRALDIGCGTGTWALDFAEAYPSTEIKGIDLSPIQPKNKPPNLSFEIDDCCSDWVYEKESFDYIHIRQMYGSVADWPKLYKECYDHLAPGGYIEQAELNPVPKSDDGSIRPGDPFDVCGKLAISAGNAFGKSLTIEETMEDDIRKAGFTDVVRRKFKWPIGAWSNDQRLKELGRWIHIIWIRGLEGWTLRFFTKHMGVRYLWPKDVPGRERLGIPKLTGTVDL